MMDITIIIAFVVGFAAGIFAGMLLAVMHYQRVIAKVFDEIEKRGIR